MIDLVIPAPESVVSLRIYGSYCRGDYDDSSDIDVLAVHASPPDQMNRDALKASLERSFRRKVDLAEYSSERIREIFLKGHLFAWHLHSESMNLLPQEDAFFSTLGEPANYADAELDSNRFMTLLDSIPNELLKVGCSYVYEAGLAYLASRNVGLICSWQHYRRPDFSRHAILNIARSLNLDMGIAPEEYDRLIDCRFATIRGQKIERPELEWALKVALDLLSSCKRIHEVVFRA